MNNYAYTADDVLSNLAEYMIRLIRTHHYTMSEQELEAYRRIVKRSFRGYDVSILEGGLAGIREILLAEREELMKERLRIPL